MTLSAPEAQFYLIALQKPARRVVELRQLKSIVAVSEDGTFVRAARRLNLAQPALSRQIRNFEREIGTAVFNRGQSGVTLTPAGEICVRTARTIIASMESALVEARLANAGRAGSCTLYVSQWCVWTGFTGRVLSHIARNDPGIDVIVREGQIGTQWHCLRGGNVDLSIATPAPAEWSDLRSDPLLNDVASVALLAPSHPLAGRTSLRLEELADDVLLTYEPSVQSTIEQKLRMAFEAVGFSPKKTRSLSTTESLVARVSAGLGWSVHRRSLAGMIPGVVTVPIEEFEFDVPVTLVSRANESRPHVLEVARRIHEVAARDYPHMYHRGEGWNQQDAAAPQSDAGVASLEIRDLRYFAAVIEEQGIGRAAARLGLTQPGLSRQMKSIERDAGVSLIARATRGVIPTPAGRTLYKAARRILGEVSRLPAEVERAQRASAGRCMLAAASSGQIRDLVSSIMRKGVERFPHLELLVENVPTPQQPSALHNGQLDLGLCHPFVNLTSEYPGTECRDLITDFIDGALLPVSHPLARKASMGLDDLAGIPFLFFHRDFHPAFHDSLLDSFRRLGYHPLMGPTQDGLNTLWALSAAGEGWTLGFGYHRANPPPGLVHIPVRGLRVPWGVSLLSRRNETRPGVLAVIDLLFEEAERRNAGTSLPATVS